MVLSLIRFIIVFALLASAPPLAFAEDGLAARERLLENDSIEVYLAVKQALRRRSNEIQTEAPVLATNGTTVANSTDFSKFLSVALNLADLTGASSGEDAPTSASATISALALTEALVGVIPGFDVDGLGDKTLGTHLRNVGLTMGFDGEEGDSGESILYGVRYKLDGFWEDSEDETKTKLKAGAFGTPLVSTSTARSSKKIAEGCKSESGTRIALCRIRDTLNNQGALGIASLSEIGSPSGARTLLRESSRLGGRFGFVRSSGIGELLTRAAVRSMMDAVREAEGNEVGLALDFTAKDRPDKGIDEYAATFNLDYRPLSSPRNSLRVNAGFMFMNIPNMSDDLGGEAAVQFIHQLGDSLLAAGNSPVEISLGAKAKWLDDASDQYAGQVKLVVPFLNGITLPISVTVANRSEFVEETEVRGIMGFTIDTSRLSELVQ